MLPWTLDSRDRPEPEFAQDFRHVHAPSFSQFSRCSCRFWERRARVQCCAQGGPPFITDDPGTPGNHHWEINFGWIANHNPGQSYYEIPEVDINYGWGDRIQLKYEIPLAAATNPNNFTGVGLGEWYPGIKWRYFEYHRAGEPKTDANLLFSLVTYP